MRAPAGQRPSRPRRRDMLAFGHLSVTGHEIRNDLLLRRMYPIQAARTSRPSWVTSYMRLAGPDLRLPSRDDQSIILHLTKVPVNHAGRHVAAQKAILPNALRQLIAVRLSFEQCQENRWLHVPVRFRGSNFSWHGILNYSL